MYYPTAYPAYGWYSPHRLYGYSYGAGGPDGTALRTQTTPYKSLEEALALIKQAVSGEREDELFYDYLIAEAPTEEDKEVIRSIRDDERRHNRMFRSIYQAYTGETLPPSTDTAFERPASYSEGLRRALFGELGAVERYRNIRAGLPDRYYRDMVFEILTDELKHASKYNYLITLDRTR